MTNIVQAMDGFTVVVGWLVKFHSNEGVYGEGLVREIKGDRVLIDPDWQSIQWPDVGNGGYWILNPDARKSHGRPDFFPPRDHGVSLGCITATKPWTPSHSPVPWKERHPE